ncbi:MAG: hypothetical protein M1298_03030 [Chloroflexi bacterium]|nr:hypothetical protein [Chloroflexota bacterium]
MLLLLMGSDVRWLDEHITAAIAPFRQQFPDATLERFDSEQLPLERISTIFAGASLFATERVVITTGLAERVAGEVTLRQALERSLATSNSLLCIVFRETTILEEKHPLIEVVRKLNGTVQPVPAAPRAGSRAGAAGRRTRRDLAGTRGRIIGFPVHRVTQDSRSRRRRSRSNKRSYRARKNSHNAQFSR